MGPGAVRGAAGRRLLQGQPRWGAPVGGVGPGLRSFSTDWSHTIEKSLLLGRGGVAESSVWFWCSVLVFGVLVFGFIWPGPFSSRKAPLAVFSLIGSISVRFCRQHFSQTFFSPHRTKPPKPSPLMDGLGGGGGPEVRRTGGTRRRRPSRISNGSSSPFIGTPTAAQAGWPSAGFVFFLIKKQLKHCVFFLKKQTVFLTNYL